MGRPKGSKDSMLRGTRLPRTIENYFLSHLHPRDDGCIEFMGPKRNGYGRFNFDGKTIAAHRYSYEYHFGPFSKDLCVLHKCDNPPCVNPTHLFLGSYTDNNHDRDKKGRFTVLVGSKNGHAKLNESIVIKIKHELKQGLTGRSIAKNHNTTPWTISLIKRNKQWRHVQWP